MLAIKSIKNLQSYTPIDINTIRAQINNKIMKSYRIWDKTKDLKQDALNINNIIESIGGDEFFKVYADTLIQMLNDVFVDTELTLWDIFDPSQTPDIRFTSLRPDHFAEDFDLAVSIIRGMVQLITPADKQWVRDLLAIPDNSSFIDALGNLDSKYFKYMPPNFGPLQKHIRSFYSRYGQLANKLEKGSEITPDDIKPMNTNLSNITGQILWEQILLIAREKVLQRFFSEIDDPAIDAFIKSGGRITFKGKQTGKEKGKKGKQTVGDSLVKVSFENSADKVIASFTLTDSTKLSNTAVATNKFIVDSTTSQAKKFTLDYLLDLVNQKAYWKDRLQVYLDLDENIENDDVNWDNTRQSFYLLAVYDVLAIRAASNNNRYANTLSINDKFYTIKNLMTSIENFYIKDNPSIKNKNIFTMGKGGGYYSWYVPLQLSISRGTDWKGQRYIVDEDSLQSSYDTYINTVLSTKIHISTNIIF